MMPRRGCHNQEIVPIGVPARRPAGNVQWTAYSRRSSVDKYVRNDLYHLAKFGRQAKWSIESSGIVYPCPRALCCASPVFAATASAETVGLESGKYAIVEILEHWLHVVFALQHCYPP
jgi:hypothetical protein